MCWHGGCVAQRGRRSGGRAGDRCADERWLRRGFQGSDRSAGHDEFVCLERERGKHRQWFWCGVCRGTHQPVVAGRNALEDQKLTTKDTKVPRRSQRKAGTILPTKKEARLV